MLPCKLSARTGTGRIAYDFVHTAFDEAERNCRPTTPSASLIRSIDLLLLPLREADTMFDRVGPEAMYIPGSKPSSANICATRIFASTRSQRHWAAPSAICTCCFSDKGMTVSDYIWRARLLHCRQELETGREDDHGCRIFVAFPARRTSAACSGSILDSFPPPSTRRTAPIRRRMLPDGRERPAAELCRAIARRHSLPPCLHEPEGRASEPRVKARGLTPG